eukprot:scaffold741_cov336-Pavlova_lutheri.AAC.3
MASASRFFPRRMSSCDAPYWARTEEGMAPGRAGALRKLSTSPSAAPRWLAAWWEALCRTPAHSSTR